MKKRNLSFSNFLKSIPSHYKSLHGEKFRGRFCILIGWVLWAKGLIYKFRRYLRLKFFSLFLKIVINYFEELAAVFFTVIFQKVSFLVGPIHSPLKPIEKKYHLAKRCVNSPSDEKSLPSDHAASSNLSLRNQLRRKQLALSPGSSSSSHCTTPTILLQHDTRQEASKRRAFGTETSPFYTRSLAAAAAAAASSFTYTRPRRPQRRAANRARREPDA